MFNKVLRHFCKGKFCFNLKEKLLKIGEMYEDEIEANRQKDFGQTSTQSQHLKAKKVSKLIGKNAVNLPSGVTLTKGEIRYISKKINDYFSEC